MARTWSSLSVAPAEVEPEAAAEGKVDDPLKERYSREPNDEDSVREPDRRRRTAGSSTSSKSGSTALPPRKIASPFDKKFSNAILPIAKAQVISNKYTATRLKYVRNDYSVGIHLERETVALGTSLNSGGDKDHITIKNQDKSMESLAALRAQVADANKRYSGVGGDARIG